MEDFNNYKCFGHLCEVPQDVLNNLNNCYSLLKDQDPNQNLGYYKQWFIQTSNLTLTDIDTSWIHWKDGGSLDITKDFFQSFVTKIYRFRFSYLNSNSVVDYHARHQLPRIHIPLNNTNSIFCVKDLDGNEHFYELKYKHAHFINVTLPHKVISSSSDERINSFFSFTNFKNEKIKEKFLK